MSDKGMNGEEENVVETDPEAVATLAMARPLCILLCQPQGPHKKQLLHAYEELAEQLPPKGILLCLDVLMLPLATLVSTSGEPFAHKELAFSIISRLLARLPAPMSAEMNQRLLHLIAPFLIPSYKISEEAKLYVLRSICVLVMFAPCSDEMSAFLLSKCLDVATEERNKELMSASLSLLRLLISSLSLSLLNNFFPGLSSGLCKIILSDYKKGHGVVVQGLHCFDLLLSRVLSDKEHTQYLHSRQTKPSQLLGEWARQAMLKTEVSNSSSSASADTSLSSAFSSSVPAQESDRMTLLLKNVNLLLLRLFSPTSHILIHSNVSVRLQCVKTLSSILLNSSALLRDNIATLLNCILILSRDPIQSVSSESVRVLMSFSQLLSQPSSFLLPPFSSLLKECFDQHLVSLSRLVHSCKSDSETNSIVRLTSGYLYAAAVTGSVKELLSSSLPSLSRSLIYLFEVRLYDIKNTQIVNVHKKRMHGEDTSQTSRSSVSPSASTSLPPSSATIHPGISYPRLIYEHFDDLELEKELNFLCHLIVRYGDRWFIFEHFTSLLLGSEHPSLQALSCIRILKEFALAFCDRAPSSSSSSFRGSFPDSSDTVADLNDSRLEGTEPPISSTPSSSSLSVDLLPFDGLSLEEARLVLRQCLTCKWLSDSYLTALPSPPPLSQIRILEFSLSLFLQLIASLSLSLSRAFDNGGLLLLSLYFICEHLGSSSPVVSSSSFLCLQSIATSCEYVDITMLVSKNIDYIVDSLSCKIESPETEEDQRKAMETLLGLLTFCDDSILLYVYDTLQLILHRMQNTCKPSHSEITYYASSSSSSFSSYPQRYINQRTLFHILRNVARLLLHKQHQNTGGRNGADVNNSSSIPSSSEEKVQASRVQQLYVSLLQSILENVVNFLSFPDKESKLLVLDTVDYSVCALHLLLSQQPDSNILPILHKLWNPLVVRVRDKDNVVVAAALRVVVSFSTIGKEFLSNKIKEDIWPILKEKIKSITASILASSSSTLLQRQDLILTSPSDSIASSHLTLDMNSESVKRLCVNILSTLSSAIAHCSLSVPLLQDICYSCLPFLSDTMPTPIISSSLALYKTLSCNASVADTLWFICHSVLQTHFLTPTTHFPTLTCPSLSHWLSSSYISLPVSSIKNNLAVIASSLT